MLLPAQWRLLAEKIIRQRAGSLRDMQVPVSLQNLSQPSAPAELPPALLKATAIPLHQGGRSPAGTDADPAPAWSPGWLLPVGLTVLWIPEQMAAFCPWTWASLCSQDRNCGGKAGLGFGASNWRRLGGCCEGATQPAYPLANEEQTGTSSRVKLFAHHDLIIIFRDSCPAQPCSKQNTVRDPEQHTQQPQLSLRAHCVSGAALASLLTGVDRVLTFVLTF